MGYFYFNWKIDLPETCTHTHRVAGQWLSATLVSFLPVQPINPVITERKNQKRQNVTTSTRCPAYASLRITLIVFKYSWAAGGLKSIAWDPKCTLLLINKTIEHKYIICAMKNKNIILFYIFTIWWHNVRHKYRLTIYSLFLLLGLYSVCGPLL